MSSELHQRARALLDRSFVEGISEDEQRWLRAHLAECAECTRYAELSRRAVQALGAFAIDVDPAAALRVQQAVLAHAARRRDFSLGARIAIVLTVIGSAVMWKPAEWLAVRWNLPAHLWQVGFVILWVLPSVLITGLLLFRRWLADHAGHEGDAV